MRLIPLLSLLLVSCGSDQVLNPTPLPTQTSTTNPVVVNVTVNVGTQPSPTPSPSSSCPVVTSCGISSDLDGQVIGWTTHDIPRLDVTPKDKDRNPVPTACHSPTVAWALSGNSSCRLLNEQQGFNPYIQCPSSGDVLVSASTSGVNCQSTFKVQ